MPYVRVELRSTTAQVSGRASSVQPPDINMAPGAAQTRDVCMAFRGNMGHEHQHRLYGCRTMDPDVALRGSRGQDITMASGSSVGYSHQAVPRHSRSTSLHSAQTVPVLSLPLLLFHILAYFGGTWMGASDLSIQ